MVKAQNVAFKSGDMMALWTSRANLNHAIRIAKRAHVQKVQDFFHDPTNTRRMWQGIKVITDYKPTPPPCDKNNFFNFLNELNNHFGRFEVSNTTPTRKSVPRPDEQPLSLDTADVRRTLRKAAGPGNIPGRVLKECADQLRGVLTDIFNTSLIQAVVRSCLKIATIIPVPKKPTISSVND